ncbi:hypothetical protein [Streptomyces sp. NBC_00094]|uniref:hypothetical protein n=1 Tax=Streptomyces sp. NBC_00094 TaxID=2903620 RepID=UPI002250636A|nr:hypothetical protein [Streptomyces sp. NBC_00094]MCX5392207.1 hypothetical protein [Streptomyces sp. NBC_00094]
MANKNDWRNHPHWYLLILVPVLVFLIIEDDVITRSLLAGGLFSGGVLYGRGWVKRGDRMADRSG